MMITYVLTKTADTTKLIAKRPSIHFNSSGAHSEDIMTIYLLAAAGIKRQCNQLRRDLMIIVYSERAPRCSLLSMCYKASLLSVVLSADIALLLLL